MKAAALAALVAVLLLPCAAAARPKAARGTAPAQARRAGVVARLPLGPTLESGGERYRVLGGVRALARAAGETEAELLSRAGVSSEDVVERKGELVVHRDPGAAARASAPAGADGARAVALNVRTGGLGMVSGILNVRLRDRGAAAGVAAAHGLELVSAAPRLGLAFLRAPGGEDLHAIASALAQDARVAEAEIEVLEHLAVPR
jgi:hypothetical protein